jgi:hypothetical protein
MPPMIGMKVLNKKPLGNYMDIRMQRKEAMGEAKHKARVNKMEGKKINVQEYGTALIQSYTHLDTKTH